jgi:hypothetical protein
MKRTKNMYLLCESVATCIADELNEMEQALEEMSLVQGKQEHRKKLLAKLSKPEITSHEQPIEERKADNSVQLGLF